jgi:hypothetical protein
MGITRSKQAWKLLEELECELNTILKYTFNAYAQFESVFDDDGSFVNCRFISVNDAYERLMGVTNQQVYGKTVYL